MAGVQLYQVSHDGHTNEHGHAAIAKLAAAHLGISRKHHRLNRMLQRMHECLNRVMVRWPEFDRHFEMGTGSMKRLSAGHPKHCMPEFKREAVRNA